MGSWLSYLPVFRPANKRISIFGLDAAGKTSILYRLKLGKDVVAIPTIGFNVEDVRFGGGNWTLWEVGGGYKIRELTHHYVQNSCGLIFVVDSNDEERIGEARTWLQGPHFLAQPALAGLPVLVFANKQDLPSALSPLTVADRMGIHEMGNERQAHVQGCSAQTGDGLSEGFKWLATAVKNTI